jgi:hypothetical protein
MLQKLVLKATYLHFFVVMEHIVVLLVDPTQNPISVPLMTTKLENVTLSYAILDAPIHLTSTFAWEKLVVSD